MKEPAKTVQDRYTLKTFFTAGECELKLPNTLRTEKGMVYMDNEGNLFCMTKKEFERRFVCVR